MRLYATFRKEAADRFQLDSLATFTEECVRRVALADRVMGELQALKNNVEYVQAFLAVFMCFSNHQNEFQELDHSNGVGGCGLS